MFREMLNVNFSFISTLYELLFINLFEFDHIEKIVKTDEASFLSR